MSTLSSLNSDIQSGIQGLQTYSQTSGDLKTLKKGQGDSLTNIYSNVSTQLGKIKEQQKRFQRSTPTSMDSLLDFIGGTRGNSNGTFQYLRKKLLEALTKIEPSVRNIVIDGALKTLGCSEEQTYKGYQPSQFPIQFISSLSARDGIYIPLKSLDFLGNLKIDPNTDLGKLYYEPLDPSSERDSTKPYGGRQPYPFNKMLNFSTSSTNINKNYTQIYQKYYQGKSGQRIFDLQYTKTNDLGVTGDYVRVFLLDKNGSNTQNQNIGFNSVKQFFQDYFSTIKIVELPSVMASLINYSTGFVSIKGGFTYDRVNEESKIEILITRILGLCNDSRKEIDVSGTAKVPELDGVDESFFEFNEVDLRSIDDKINNIRLGIVKLESCGDVELPVNADLITQEIVNFSESLSGLTPQQQVTSMESILDSVIENPVWNGLLPTGVDGSIEFNKNFIKDLPKAIGYSILSPKTLLPLYSMYYGLYNSGINVVNQSIQTGNTFIASAQTNAQSILQSGSTVGQTVDNVVENGVDFFKKFKTFVIDLLQRINAEFLEVLFEILKKDILNLIDVIISDIGLSTIKKRYRIFIRLVQLAIIVAQLRGDYRKCKSLLDSIKNLLSLVNQVTGISSRIPNALLPLTTLLPGQSPERALLNTIKNLQQIGLPTGPLPDGSPNLVNQMIDSVVKGIDQEMSENGTVDAMVIVPPLTGGLLKVFAKQR